MRLKSDQWQVQIGAPDCQPWLEWYRAASPEAALAMARERHYQRDPMCGVGPVYDSDGRLVE